MIVVSAHSPPCPAPLSYTRWIFVQNLWWVLVLWSLWDCAGWMKHKDNCRWLSAWYLSANLRRWVVLKCAHFFEKSVSTMYLCCVRFWRRSSLTPTASLRTWSAWTSSVAGRRLQTSGPLSPAFFVTSRATTTTKHRSRSDSLSRSVLTNASRCSSCWTRSRQTAACWASTTECCRRHRLAPAFRCSTQAH